MQLDLAVEIAAAEYLTEAAHTIVGAGVSDHIDLSFIVAVDDGDTVLADTLECQTHHLDVEVLGLCDIDSAVHAGGIKATDIGEGEKLDLVFIEHTLQHHLVTELCAEHIAYLAVEQFFIAGAGVETELGCAGGSARICKHDDLINLVRLQKLEHVGHGDIALACPGGTVEHRDLIIGETVEGKLLVDITVFGLDGIKHHALEALVIDLDMGFSCPAEHIGDIAVLVIKDDVLVGEQIIDIGCWIFVQGGVLCIVENRNFFITGVVIVAEDVCGGADGEVKIAGCDKLAADIIGAECKVVLISVLDLLCDCADFRIHSVWDGGLGNSDGVCINLDLL